MRMCFSRLAIQAGISDGEPMSNILQRVFVDASGFTEGVLTYAVVHENSVPGATTAALRLVWPPPEAWTAFLNQGGSPRATQLRGGAVALRNELAVLRGFTAMAVFDFLVDNRDRFSSTNIHVAQQSGGISQSDRCRVPWLKGLPPRGSCLRLPLVFLDNDEAFKPPPPGASTRTRDQWGELGYASTLGAFAGRRQNTGPVCQIDAALLTRIEELPRHLAGRPFSAVVSQECGALAGVSMPPLAAARLSDLDARWRRLLRHVEECVAAFGQRAVALPE